ncbi:phage tail terminator family protein [Heliophilum fasciatum]|uniref:Uncharacterized protein n=1 Tax=Heliophilum fasciatum TaxID=35700 RepID=A0A4R2RLG7_9FIRM|nr:hypothetical protein [Heliophilum fasciatum]MCW2277735.1 hypothetical protein [Heliophilum fasciatum]TCP64770.1 hypothetical protein EDD73_108123 [Heliophilum fasciatum]
MTINQVRDGVIASIRAIFPDKKIYGEAMKQGVTVPCFFVKILLAEQTNEVGRRLKRTVLFDVHYFADTNEEAHEVAEQLYQMGFVTVQGSLLRGKKMRHEIVDGVLHFFVEYEFHLLREVASGPTMQTLEQEANLIG